MRLSSLLPMLLLLVSPLAAQQNCSIFDLTASVVQFDPNSCQFFVVLDFQHTGTTNQYSVRGNGHNYGTFEYSHVPLTLGPLLANPNMASSFEFVVQDAVLQDCFDQVTIDVPACVPTTCHIFDLTAVPGDCHLNNGTYNLTVNFQTTNPGNGFFEMWAANGTPLGTFPLASLPLTIQNFPWGGGANDLLKVCINDQPNCCESLEFPAPACFHSGCSIAGLAVNTGDCTSDSTYKALVNFDISSTTVPADSFQLFLDGVPQGVFALTQLPLPVIFETNGTNHALAKVCIEQNGQVCCIEKEFTPPTCLLPCAIHNLIVETDTCSSDSTFGIWVNFQVTDPTAVDSFSLWGNGGTSLGHFGMNQLPLYIPNFEWNGLVFNHIRVCTGNDPACCKELQFTAPNCLPFGPCEITNIFTHTGACTSDSTYNLVVNFNASNPGNGTFIVWTNGVLLDTFNLSEAPLTIPNFLWNGGANDVITICIGGVPGASNIGCCKTKEFAVPDCLGSCAISNLHVQAGDCDPVTHTYPLTINFTATHPGNTLFDVWANNQHIGTYALSQLPLTIPNYAATGNAVDVIKVCINDHPNCCAVTEFQTPSCDALPCHIFDLVVHTGDCVPGSNTYALTINFAYTNPGSDHFEVWANGQLFGTYSLNQLPLTIPNFPATSNAIAVVKVCITDHPDCCISKEFQAPNCNQACHIFDLVVHVTGDCNPATNTYPISINFGVTNPGNDLFEVWANGQLFGTYPLNQLPLAIPNFPASGNAFDVIKVCINDHPDCCITKDIQAPSCGSCEINNLHVETGDCNADNTYNLWLNFSVSNSPATQFVVWGNNIQLGVFNLNQLPLHITNFPWDGAGPNDVIKVCIGGNTGALTCCKTLEFPTPDCVSANDCSITNLHVETGNCTSDSSYVLSFSFTATNPPASVFGMWANGQFIGMYGLGQLPVTIQNFPWNGGANDVIKVCFTNTPGTVGDCCAQLEFPVPACLTSNNDCEIFNLVVDPGDCTSDSTYNLHLNFQVSNPPGNTFAVWANGNPFGTYNLSQLPLVLQNFPWNGGANDVIKVCMVSPNAPFSCCRTLEFAVPNCLGGGGACEIFGMVVDPGDCTSDSTYSLFLNFQVSNPPGNVFGVWANNVLLGTFNLSQLPLNFPNFPWNGGANDVIKVCFLSPTGNVECCRTLEFPVPGCLGNPTCHIWDVYAVHTACLCGQFFAVITFNHANGGNGGFDIVGNGHNYGNFPYSTHQPIILGPLPGDGTTNYEFGVIDHNHPDCHDGYVLGEVDCQTPVVEPGNASSLVIAPNPASSWLNVTAMLGSGEHIGQATVKVFHADGRLVQTIMVGNAANFQLDVSNLPSGVYRIAIVADAGRLEGSFTKQ